MKRSKAAMDATDYRREAYNQCNLAAHCQWPDNLLRRLYATNLADHADYLESQEPAAHQPAGFIKLYPSQ